ncbi:hypothetical protein CY35_02G088200 [Sphagnum magellanicum]|nr:hypothetical protein CY35_02G088200 [Sphagnum magellanicum]KAH9571301.1 hypothetical protein CY35_02G088200 [Sphagnum magellanicum]
MDAGSAAALYAGSVLIRKTFEAVAQRSVSSLFTRLHTRFRGQHQLQVLQKELESRLQVLSLPVDMCVQYVLHGNTALQGALDMALRVINDIVSFQEELEAQAYNESIVKVSQADAAARLQGFMSRLDLILPYLSMAVNAVSLLKLCDTGLSPSRLMESSHLIRTAGSRQGTVISIHARLYKFETKLTLPRWQEKMMTCRIALQQSSTLPGLGASEFELYIEEEVETSDTQCQIRFPISDIAAVGSSTLHVLGLGEHELEAVLLVDSVASTASRQLDISNEALSTPLQESAGKAVHYAFECIEDAKTSETEGSDSDGSVYHDGDTSEGNSQQGDACSMESALSSKTAKLGVLEYALRLCMLQIREEKEHWLVADERIHMFFLDPRYISEPMGNVLKSHNRTVSGNRIPTPRKTTPVAAKSSLGSSTGLGVPSSRPSTSRTNVAELFYDLRLDSP